MPPPEPPVPNAGDRIEERLRTALAERYHVQHKLGEGGMALVYLAQDLKHDRLVALKVLKPDLAASIGGDRFLKEIRHTAKLSHPHILPLYDSGEASGLLYYVMPFVEGESLADLIRREKQLVIEEAVQIAREVAEALAHAHSYGLIHRDIKPANILLSGSHAIVADFGISKALSDAVGDQLTQTGTSVGTPAYMSPEQATGSSELDGRSDIYSLGCVLYEMLVGDVPFTGPTPQAMMARHTLDQIPPPHIMRDTITPDLEDIIYTAMAKTPADRYRTAHEFAEALHAVETGKPPPPRRSATGRTSTGQRPATYRSSIAQTPETPVPTVAVPGVRPAWRRAAVPAGLTFALVVGGLLGWGVFGKDRGTSVRTVGTPDARRVAVLYFEDRSRDTSLAYLADGLTEALIDRLSAVPRLTVLSRNAVAPYRAADIPRDSIGRALEVGSLVTGSVEPVSDRVRVTVRLVDGFSGSEIQSRSFELSGTQVLAMRDSAAGLVARFFLQRLGEELVLRERRAGTQSVQAWSLVQRAEKLRKDAASLRREDAQAALRRDRQADSLLGLAEAADPSWVEPVVLRGHVAFDRAALQDDKYRRLPLIEEGLAHAERALRMASGHPSALALRGMLRYEVYRLNVTPDPDERSQLLDQAEADLETATQADETLARAWYILSLVRYDKKDDMGSLLAATKAYEADPFLRGQEAALVQLFWTHYNLERFPDAQRYCEDGARRFPANDEFTECRLWMLITPWLDPDVDRAWALSGALDTLVGQADREFVSRLGRLVVGGVLARADQPDSARRVLEAARAGREVDPEQELPAYEAIMRVILGDTTEAVTLLKQYVAINPGHEFNVGRDLHWWWRPLRDHSGFRAVSSQRRHTEVRP